MTRPEEEEITTAPVPGEKNWGDLNTGWGNQGDHLGPFTYHRLGCRVAIRRSRVGERTGCSIWGRDVRSSLSQHLQNDAEQSSPTLVSITSFNRLGGDLRPNRQSVAIPCSIRLRSDSWHFNSLGWSGVPSEFQEVYS